MSRYEIYLTFHVLMAIVWLGGGLPRSGASSSSRGST